jgi:hypothetical protein
MSDRAARLAALRDRRQATTPMETRKTTIQSEQAVESTNRRRHAASGGRVLAAGVSVSASLVLMNVMAAARSANTTGVTAPAPSPAAPSFVIVHQAATSMAATPAPRAPTPSVNAPPVTSTHGS